MTPLICFIGSLWFGLALYIQVMTFLDSEHLNYFLLYSRSSGFDFDHQDKTGLFVEETSYTTTVLWMS